MMTNSNYKDIEKVLRDRLSRGDSMQDIAMSLDVSKMQVSRLAKKYNLKPANKFPKGG